jgi:hypothetical protein
MGTAPPMAGPFFVTRPNLLYAPGSKLGSPSQQVTAEKPIVERPRGKLSRFGKGVYG